MSYGTQSVLHNGSTVTFHRNKRSPHRGFIYAPRDGAPGGRRVYGTIGMKSGSWDYVFTPNAAALASV